MSIMTTRDGQTLDDIVYEVYGLRPQMLDALTNANPDVLNLGIHLPAGIEINLPPIEDAAAITTTINLWTA